MARQKMCSYAVFHNLRRVRFDYPMLINGTSSFLTDKFIKGANEEGNAVFRFNAASKKVHPCIGCDKCECGKNECVFKDDMLALYPKIIEADTIVFSTPIYYHSYSAQLKAVIDRFHAIDDIICGQDKKAVLLAAGANQNKWIVDGLLTTYHTELRYLGREDCGSVIATGCFTSDDIKKTDYPNMAYILGRSVNKNE